MKRAWIIGFGVVCALSWLGRGAIAKGLVPENRPTSLFVLVSESQVRQDLDLLDEQLEQIKRAHRDASQLINQELKDAVRFRGSRADRAEAVRQVVARAAQIEEEFLKPILLDHQFRQLKIIWCRREIDRRGFADVLDKSLGDEIKLDPAQLQKIRDIEQEALAEFQLLVKEMRHRQHRRMLEILSPRQRKQLSALIGPPQTE